MRSEVLDKLSDIDPMVRLLVGIAVGLVVVWTGFYMNEYPSNDWTAVPRIITLVVFGIGSFITIGCALEDLFG